MLESKKNCKTCNEIFEITDEDFIFYEKMGVLEPTLCSQCRQIRRFAWRNERKMYYRNCDATGKKIISHYSSDKKFPVYETEYWWSDKWDGLDYGKDFDFEKGFFEQFDELMNKVPRMSLINILTSSENCDWSPYCSNSKNCYLSISCNSSENVHFSLQVNESEDCLDCSMSKKCINNYESINCTNSYKLFFSQFCNNCSDSWFLKNCNSCKNCFACHNLESKEYCFLNKQLSKEEYFEKINSMNLNKYSVLKNMREEFMSFVKKFPHKYMFGEGNEDCSGDNIHNSKNSHNCFDANGLENCKNVIFLPYNLVNSQDVNYSPNGENLYDVMSGVDSKNSAFLLHSWSDNKIFYTNECFNCEELFGCVGLKNKQYCIFNKQYSKEEYFRLKEKIIEQMKAPPQSPSSKGEARNKQVEPEWGEFFPVIYSPFGYNETIAMDYFPLSKEKAIQKGFKWKEDEELATYSGPRYEIPDNILEISEEILQKILVCKTCEKNYRIIGPELQFYKKYNLPIPRNCPNCRHINRMKLRNPRKLFERICNKCSKEIKSTYSPDRNEIVYCESCYEKEIY